MASASGDADTPVAFDRAQASRDRAAACRTRAEAARSADVRQLVVQMAEAHDAAARQYDRAASRDWQPGRPDRGAVAS
jgi:hypothetical protein